MTLLQSLSTLTAALLFTTGVLAEDAKPAEWLFVHTAQTAEMTSDTTLVMPVTREIFAFTDRPNRLHGYLNAHEFASMWNKGEGDTFQADPPNAVLTWIDSEDVKETEVVITNAAVTDNGRSIVYELVIENGDVLIGKMQDASFFIDPLSGDKRYRKAKRNGKICDSRDNNCSGIRGGIAPRVNESSGAGGSVYKHLPLKP